MSIDPFAIEPVAESLQPGEYSIRYVPPAALPEFGDVMIDLETMAVRPGAAITSIGAVKFDLAKGTIGPTFYGVMHLADSQKRGFTFDAGTILFWMRQSEEARMAAINSAIPVAELLQAFSDWMGPGVRPWGNAASFDCSILSRAYEIVGIKTPWFFTQERCYRTVKALFPMVVEEERIGVHHNAIDDALHQTKHLMKIRAHLRGRK